MEKTVAFSVWQDRISPLFDASQSLLVFKRTEGGKTAGESIVLAHTLPDLKAREMADLGITHIVCGAISRPFAEALENRQIHCLPFVAGNTDQIIKTYFETDMLPQQFRMPGCRQNRCRRHRGGRG